MAPKEQSLEKIIRGTVVEASSNLLTGVVVENPRLQGAAVTVLHSGTVGAVLQTTDGQTWLGDDVEEGVLLQCAMREEEQMVMKVKWESHRLAYAGAYFKFNTFFSLYKI